MNLTTEQEQFINNNYDEYFAGYVYNCVAKEDYLHAPEHVLELFDQWGLLEDEINPYLQFSNYLNEKTDIARNVIEVSAGRLARVSQKIAHLQFEKEAGTITAYDKYLLNLASDNQNYKLVRENFSEKTNIVSTDLIVALKACGATEIIIKRAIEEKKDFVIALCDCDHSPAAMYDGYYDLAAYRNDLRTQTLELLEKHDGGDLVEDVLSGTYRVDIPVWRNVKVKRK